MKRVFLLVWLTCIFLFCFASAAFTADGFGRYTTGGAGGTVVNPTTAADFESYVESTSTYIVQVSGVIDLGSVGGVVQIRPNKTITGITAGAKIIGRLAFRDDASNVIIEKLIITNPADDGISVRDRVTNVFINKCTFYDCGDGCIDITNESDYITVSWCKFYYVSQPDHRFVNLIGNSDSATGDDGRLHVTIHHNWWSTLCHERMPRVRYGQVHCYNNYYACTGNNYCIRPGVYAKLLVENNYFNNVDEPIDTKDTGALVEASGNIYDNCTNVHSVGTDDVFTPPYSYILDDAADVPAIVPKYAGAENPDLPHWFFSLYGDFDISGLVDINDLGTFVDYWLQTGDVADINDADYNIDGTVNGYEYALLAENYLNEPPDITAPAAPQNLSATAGDGSVSLDWNENTEPDLDGYNVYRSTTFGNGFVKLNGSLLKDSNYLDGIVTNGTVYFYVATAVDKSSNESGDSTVVSAIPIDANTIILQENEAGFCDVNGTVDNDNAGYTGDGFSNTDNAVGNGIDWSIEMLSAGTCTFTWRYANGGSADRPGRLLVNNSEVVSNISYPVTGGWTTWTTTSAEVTLTTGVKEIRLEATDADGLANIDYMQATGSNLRAASCP